MTRASNGVPAASAATRPRFYKAVTVADSPPPMPEACLRHDGEGLGVGGAPTADVAQSPPPSPSPTRGEGRPHTFRILLDGKPIRTPAKKELALPSRALAEAVASEWDAQTARIDPATMPLTRLANSAIDGVTGREAEVRADIVKYAGSDLLCYRAESPIELARRQAAAWDPVLAWARDALGASFHVAQGIMHAAQPAPAIAGIARAVGAHGAFSLAALHVMTTLTGSALLALAHAHGSLTAEEAWAAAHVDEDYQVSQWGEDAEAKARREHRWMEMQAASRFLMLL